LKNKLSLNGNAQKKIIKMKIEGESFLFRSKYKKTKSLNINGFRKPLLKNTEKLTMKKLLIGITLLSISLISFADTSKSSISDRCFVNINYVYGVEGQDELKFVNSSAGPVTYMQVSKIEKLLKVALNEKGYGITTDGSSSDYELKFNYFHSLNNDGTTFGGIDLTLVGPNGAVGINQTPGLIDLIFRSQGTQVVNTTKSAIASFGKHLHYCN